MSDEEGPEDGCGVTAGKGCGLAFLALFLLALVSGIVQTIWPDDEQGSQPAPQRTTPPATDAAARGDAAFLRVMRAAFPDLVDTDDGLIESGHTVCDSFRVGDSFDEIAEAWGRIGREVGLMGPEADEFAGTLIGASTAAYCPEYP